MVLSQAGDTIPASDIHSDQCVGDLIGGTL